MQNFLRWINVCTFVFRGLELHFTLVLCRPGGVLRMYRLAYGVIFIEVGFLL